VSIRFSHGNDKGREGGVLSLSKNHRWNIFDGFPFREWSVPAIKPDINAVLKSSEKKRIKDVILEQSGRNYFTCRRSLNEASLTEADCS
jgi:hypothetical protein